MTSEVIQMRLATVVVVTGLNIYFKKSKFKPPPYENTNKYYAVDKFDSKKFWDNVRRWSKHNIVIVSEFKAPKDFVCIWSKDKVTNWGENKPCKITERLFIHKKNKK